MHFAVSTSGFAIRSRNSLRPHHSRSMSKLTEMTHIQPRRDQTQMRIAGEKRTTAGACISMSELVARRPQEKPGLALQSILDERVLTHNSSYMRERAFQPVQKTVGKGGKMRTYEKAKLHMNYRILERHYAPQPLCGYRLTSLTSYKAAQPKSPQQTK